MSSCKRISLYEWNVQHVKYSLVLNKRESQNSRGREIFRKYNKRGVPNKQGEGKLGNSCLKIRYKIMFFMTILKLFYITLAH